MISRKTIAEDTVYHITQRAPGKEALFVEENDYLRFLKLLKETSREFSIDVFCFALLSNHLHILLKTKEKNLDKAMKFLFQSYAQSFNKKYQRKGHVFCGVYRASLCMDDSYLLTASLYIHLNPYKAGLTPNLFKYRWFSLQPYIEPIKSSFLKVSLILDILDDKDRDKAHTIYRKLIKESVNFKFKNILETQNAIKGFYEDFLRWFKKNWSKISPKNIDGFNSYLELERKIEEIKLKKRFIEPETKTALLYLIEQLEARGYNLEEIAEKIGISRKTLWRVRRESQLSHL